MKKCYKCNNLKDEQDFKKNKNLCKLCHNLGERKRYKDNPNIVFYNRIKNAYNLDKNEYDNLLNAQNHVCYICKKSEIRNTNNIFRLVVDHCHKTKKTRKLLCHKCNTCIGHLRENTEIILKCIEYLNQHNK